MRLRQESYLKLATLWFLTPAILLSTTAAKADSKTPKGREHIIQQGETLGEIAEKHGISQQDLMAANALDNADKIFYGQKLVLPVDPKHGVLTKNGVLVPIPKGFTLSRIAAAYGLSMKSIIRANRLDNPDRLRDGDKILIPGARRIVELVPPPPCYKPPLTFYRVRTDETLKVSLLFCNGKVNSAGMKKLSDFADSIKNPVNIPLHPRLARLLYKISEQYPGKRLEVISAQRKKRQKGNESYHNKGRAIDFRVQGVSNFRLSQFIRGFDAVGVGYYPNSVFVHMDTREREAYWIDYSAPGEKAIYGRKGMTDEEIADIRAKRRGNRTAKNDKPSQREAELAKKDDQDDELSLPTS